jgi:hypothetical protein
MEVYSPNHVTKKLQKLRNYQQSLLELGINGSVSQALSRGFGIQDDTSQENYIQMLVDSIRYVVHPGIKREHYYVLNHSYPQNWYSILDNHSGLSDSNMTEAKDSATIIGYEEQAYFSHNFEFTYYLSVGARRKERMENHMLLSEFETQYNKGGLSAMRIGINNTKKDAFIDSEFSRGKCIYIDANFKPLEIRYLRPLYRGIVWSEAFVRYDKQFGNI